MSKIYVIGSLRAEQPRQVAHALRDAGHDVFDEWHGFGPESDDHWMRYERARGRTYREALYEGKLADHAFEFDRKHIHWADVGVLVLPAGKSGHLELGYMIGRGQRGFILLEEPDPERWDVMYLFAHRVCGSIEELVENIT